MNVFNAEKVPVGEPPVPRIFHLENEGKGSILYQNKNEEVDIWGADMEPYS